MKKCPFSWEPCLREGCELWVAYPASSVSETTGQKVVKEKYMCTLNWQTQIQFDTAGFHDYTGKAVDRLRSESDQFYQDIMGLRPHRQRLAKQ